jgi:hypothetical protein
MTTARTLLLEAMGEEEFAQQVKRWARRAGWCGYHVRYSHAVVEGIHTQLKDGHSDAHGMPDWVFAKAGQPLLLPELKSAHGRVSKDQKRWLALLEQATGVAAPLWLPTDEDLIRRVLG